MPVVLLKKKKREIPDEKEQEEEMFGRVKRPRMRKEAVSFILPLWRAIDETARAITVVSLTACLPASVIITTIPCHRRRVEHSLLPFVSLLVDTIIC